MATKLPLTEAFLAQRGMESVTIPVREAIERQLTAMVEAGRERWPTVELGAEQYAEYVSARIPDDDEPLGGLNALRASDIYLACACTVGAEGGPEAFTVHFAALVEGTLRRLCGDGGRDDVKQQLLERLLLARGERPPAIALYSGHGPLDAYLRVAATREGFKLIKRERKETVGVSELLDRVATSEDPEAAALKRRYGAAFKTAFHEALQGLDPSHRSLLRYHYVDQLTVRQIAAIARSHNSTVTRQLAQVRAKLLSTTRNKLTAKLRLRADEVASIVRLVESQLDLSLTRMLASRRK